MRWVFYSGLRMGVREEQHENYIRSYKMAVRRYPSNSKQILTKCLSWVALSAFLLANFPFPLPARIVSFSNPAGLGNGRSDAADQDSDQTPFPCQDGRCGCATAQKCWTDCCCHTPAERRRWAENRGITPPAYAVLSDVPRSTKTQKVEKDLGLGNIKSCCVTKKPKKAPSTDCQSNGPNGSARSCGSNKLRERTVLSMLACKCRGASSLFTTLTWFVHPTPCIAQTPAEFLDEPLDVLDQSWKTSRYSPPSRPPWSI